VTTRRAVRKKSRRQFQVGDAVTWGNGRVAHRVLEVKRDGLVVDSTSSGFGRRDRAGRLTMLIEFAPASKSRRCHGPPRHADETVVVDNVTT
jgi:hypothetical protein